MKVTPEPRPLVTFWGTRGSISTPGRMTEKYGGNTACVTVQCRDAFIILDAGTGIRNLGIELVEQCKGRADQICLHLFLSHTHWDHIQGLPFFEPAYLKEATLTIYGSPQKEDFLASILKGLMDSEYFPVGMAAFSADIHIHEISEEVIHLGEVTIAWQEQLYHPGGSVRYRFDVNGRKIVYATDVELNRMFHPDQGKKEQRARAQDYLEFIHDADLLIADGQYTEQEYLSKVGWGHSSMDVVLDAAYQAHVKQLAIFHHDPQHSDSFLDQLWMRNRSQFHSAYEEMDVFWAREGLTLAL